MNKTMFVRRILKETSVLLITAVMVLSAVVAIVGRDNGRNPEYEDR